MTEPLVARLAVDPEHARVLEQLQLRSSISAPMVGRNGPLGVINFVRVGDSPAYKPEDRALAEELARRAAMAIDNSMLHARQAEVAELLQRSLLPPTLPDIPGLRLAAIYQPAGTGSEVGGDFYDVFGLPGERWGLMIGDVCGTGPSAAAVTAQVRHTARAIAGMGASPDEVVTHVNDALVGTIGDDRFCTMVFGIMTVSPGHGANLALVGAGHPPPLLVRADGRLEEVSCGGPLLGVVPSTRFRTVSVELQPGETLLLYTDGVPEARPVEAGPDGRRGYFGLDPVEVSTRSTAGEPAASIVSAIHTMLRGYTGGRLADDVALLAVQAAVQVAG
jgi:serine phosphatase RsbU (regulator of sigma subunit)